MLIETKYHKIRERIKNYDVIAFSGKGITSSLIKIFSGVTHVALVMKPTLRTGERLNLIIEATSLDGNSGVVVNRLSNRLKYYEGEAWWLPLKEELRIKADGKEAYEWLKKQKGKPYDYKQAIGSALDLLWNNEEDFSKFFCSETIAAFYELRGIIGEINASEVMPSDLCKFNLYKEDYYQLIGETKEIKGYNTIPPGGWVV